MSQHRIKHRARVAVRVAADQPPEQHQGEPPPLGPGDETVSAEVSRLRWHFLVYLSLHVPPFWKLLHDAVWQSKDPNAFSHWAAYFNVVDEWLLEAVDATLDYWTAFPDSPQAQLRPGYLQFFGRVGFPELKPFAPVFSDTLPRISWPEQHAWKVMCTPISQHDGLNAQIAYESPDQFEARMRDQFNEQIKGYKRDYRDGVFSLRAYLEKNRAFRDHLTWLMHRFTGASLDEVVERWPGSKRYEDPGATITRKVNELAAKMGLSLRPWTPK
jgi:hypothetical protein